MIWGLIGLAVIVSIWGLIAVLRNSFGIDNSAGNLGGGLVPTVCPAGQTFVVTNVSTGAGACQ